MKDERPGGKRARTRKLLIQCAAELVAERGFEGTTLEEVAKRAGTTRGAIYGSFKSREELLLAVAESQWQPVAPKLVPGEGLERQMRAVAAAVAQQLPERRAKAIGAVSFEGFVLAREPLRRQMEAQNAAVYSAMTEILKEALPAIERREDLETFVRVAHALTEGLFRLHALTPELIGEHEILAAFEMLAQGARKP